MALRWEEMRHVSVSLVAVPWFLESCFAKQGISDKAAWLEAMLEKAAGNENSEE